MGDTTAAKVLWGKGSEELAIDRWYPQSTGRVRDRQASMFGSGRADSTFQEHVIDADA
jgi:hypothetical protein